MLDITIHRLDKAVAKRLSGSRTQVVYDIELSLENEQELEWQFLKELAQTVAAMAPYNPDAFQIKTEVLRFSTEVPYNPDSHAKLSFYVAVFVTEEEEHYG